MISTETPLPPGSKISLEFDRSDDEFVILCPTTDTEKYRINLIEFNLYIPVAELSQNVYQEFNALLTKPRESKAGAVNIHYRRSEVRPISIPKNAQEFYSGINYSATKDHFLVFIKKLFVLRHKGPFFGFDQKIIFLLRYADHFLV